MSGPGHPSAGGKKLRWQLFTNSAAQAVGRLLVALVRLVIAGILVRAYGKESFGEYSLVMGLLTVADWLVDFGTTDVFVREYSRQPADGRRLLRILTLTRCIQIPAAALVLIGVGAALRYPPHVLLAILTGSLNLIFFGGVLIYRVIFRAELTIEHESIAELVSVLSMLPMVALTVRWHGGLVALLLCHVVSRVIYFTVCWWFGRSRFSLSTKDAGRADVRQALQSSAVIGVIGFLIGGHETIDVVVLSKLASLTDLAYYSAAQRLIWPVLMVLGSVAGTFYPVYASFWVNRRPDFDGLCQRALETILLLAGAASAVALASAEFMMGLLGPDLVGGAAALRLLSVLCFLKSITSTLGPVLYAVQAQNQALRFIVCAVLAKASLMVVLAPAYGYMGVAIGALVVEVLAGVIPTAVMVRKYAGYRVHWLCPAKIFAIMAVAGSVPRLILPPGSWMAGGVALLMYGALAILTGTFRPAELAALIKERKA